MHPNEYLRGATLRFLTKLREPEILEPLVPAVKQCLTHRHAYVRRNAVLTMYSICSQFPDLAPDVPDEVAKLLAEETDPSTRRNAFIMLFNTSYEKALMFLNRNLDKVLTFGDGFALILLELIRKTSSKFEAGVRAKFIRIVFALLENPSAAVSYEAAGTLTSLSASPSAIRAVASAYCKILIKESDNNVKLVILDRLNVLKKRHSRILRESVMDILRVLSTPNLDIRRRALDIAMDLVSTRNVDDIMGLLKKEILSTSGNDAAKGSSDAESIAYRSMLISAIHGCAVRFPDVVPPVVRLLMDFLNGDGALPVIEFVREICEVYSNMRPDVLAKLREVIPDIQNSEVYRVALWILGSYSETEEQVSAAFHTIRQCVGALPLTMPFTEYVASHNAQTSEQSAGSDTGAKASTRPVLLPDGSYASQSAMVTSASKAVDSSDVSVPTLRRQLLAGDFYLASVVSSTLTKLALRVTDIHGRDSRVSKAVLVDSMIVMCAILELGASGLAGTTTLLPAHLMPVITGRTYGAAKPSPAGAQGVAATPLHPHGLRIDQDSFERIVLCLRVLGDPASSVATLPVLLNDCRESFRELLADRKSRMVQAAKDNVSIRHSHFLTSALLPAEAEKEPAVNRIDEGLSIRQLRGGRTGSQLIDDIAFDDDAITTQKNTAVEDFRARLKRVHQLTGFGDPLYVEAFVRVSEFDIILEMLFINRTERTLTNINVELSLLGDLKLVERPSSFTLGAGDSKTIRAAIKVGSTETGHIFGTVAYDIPSNPEQFVINLSEIHVDIMDYIHPATCSDSAFRSMWADFEWENKVTVNTNITYVPTSLLYLSHFPMIPLISLTLFCLFAASFTNSFATLPSLPTCAFSHLSMRYRPTFPSWLPICMLALPSARMP